jgi:hypothetical protein
VHPNNAGEIIKQWLDVHHLPEAPMSGTVVDGHPRQVWWNADGDTMVESYTITDMAHGTPLGHAEDDKRYGRKGAFMLEAGISSSYHIAKFFGLTHWIRDSRPAIPQTPSTRLIPQVSLMAPAATVVRPKAERPQVVAVVEPAPPVQASAEPVKLHVAPEPAKAQPVATPVARREASQPKRQVESKPRRRLFDSIGSGIVRALISAGLLQRR